MRTGGVSWNRYVPTPNGPRLPDVKLKLPSRQLKSRMALYGQVPMVFPLGAHTVMVVTER